MSAKLVALPPLPVPPPAALALAAVRISNYGRAPLIDLSAGRDNPSTRSARRSDQSPAESDGDWEDETDAMLLPRSSASDPSRQYPDGEEPWHFTTALPRLVLLSHHPAFVRTSLASHTGVLVAKRQKDAEGEIRVFLERMPLATRIGMRLLYHGVDRGHFVRSKRIEEALRYCSEREGRKYDDPNNALRKIKAFIRAYRIDCSDLAQTDLRDYPTLNSFFYRRLRAAARPTAAPHDRTIVSSAADCRLTVFDTVSDAQRFWIKGRTFTLLELLQDAKLASELNGGSVAIFRLAPADYHRYHSPMAGQMGKTIHIPGAYYTVNPMVVRDKRFDAFTANKRDVTIIKCEHPLTGQPTRVAFVQIGALLVASIRQTAQRGQTLERGDEVGYFAYGGSTIVAVFPPGCVEWDRDLLDNSKGRNFTGTELETQVKVGEAIGKWIAPTL